MSFVLISYLCRMTENFSEIRTLLNQLFGVNRKTYFIALIVLINHSSNSEFKFYSLNTS
jgi:hypothetical protein